MDGNKINLRSSKTESYRIELQILFWVWFSHKLTMLVPPTVSNARGFSKVALQGVEHFFLIIACHLQIQSTHVCPSQFPMSAPSCGYQLRLCNVVCRQTFLCPEMLLHSSTSEHPNRWKKRYIAKREETAIWKHNIAHFP